MVFGKFFKKAEPLLCVDIGSSGVKLLQFDVASGDKLLLQNIASASFDSDVFSNNAITNGQMIADKIMGLLEANEIPEQRVAVAMPGPSVFTKKIKMPKQPPSELASNVHFEAGGFIPHNIDNVKIDFHVIGESGRAQLDVLVVAVKNEIIDSFLDCLNLSGLQAAIVDVDYFALQNCFEMAYPEYISETVALIDVGARYSSINICQNGQSLFTGDIAVGGRLFTDALVDELGVSFEEAEKMKVLGEFGEHAKEAVSEIIERKVEYVAAEFNRQLSLFWNASGAEEGIDRIMLTGGGALVPGLLDEITEKTGIECEFLDALKGVAWEANVDSDFLKKLGPLLSVCVGMGGRQPGDKEITEYDY